MTMSRYVSIYYMCICICIYICICILHIYMYMRAPADPNPTGTNPTCAPGESPRSMPKALPVRKNSSVSRSLGRPSSHSGFRVFVGV